ncbi:MAG TPA: DUF4255 domain-containing protein [Kineosporiaceae bacterium]|nr:DUF4255 domain-containing protein [Kineosporiaceae bacterium]
MPLSALESALQAWLREQLPLAADVGDISFDSPDASWGTSLTRPTVNLFLFDIARAAQQSVPMPPRRDQGGLLVQERPAPCVAFSYLLSTWGGGVREEHRLLGDAVRAVLRTPTLNPGPENHELVGPVLLSMSETNDVRARELWQGLGGRLRAGLVLVAMTAVPLGRATPLATPVETVLVEVTPTDRASTRTAEKPAENPVTAEGPVMAENPVIAEGPVIVEGSVLENDAPRRYVWFGPRQPRRRGRP